MTTPIGPDTLFRRKKVADQLTQHGFPVSPTTLASMVTRGGGPPYHAFGRVPLYRWGDALDWAHSRLSPPRRSSSEADIRAQQPQLNAA
jgi:hypothetical protein